MFFKASHSQSNHFSIAFTKRTNRSVGNIAATFAALVFYIMISVGLSLAQTTELANNLDILKKQANLLVQTANILERITTPKSVDDETLVGAGVKYQNIITDANSLIREIETQSNTLTERLEDIGPAPDNNIGTEAFEVTETRTKLTQEKSSLAVSKTSLEDLKLKLDGALVSISNRRKEAFSAALSERTVLTKFMSYRAVAGLGSELASAKSLFTNWLNFLVTQKFWEAIGSALVSLALALFLSLNFNRFFGDYIKRPATDPDYFSRVFNTFWSSILPSLTTAIFLGVSYGLFSHFELFNSKVSIIIWALFLAIAGTVFAWNFCRAVYAPKAASWRLFPMATKPAKRMFWLTFALFAIYAFDNLFDTVNGVLATDLAVTVLRGVIAALLIGGILIAIALINPDITITKISTNDDGTTDEQTDHRNRFPRWITIPLIITGGIIILSAIIGYIGFARFIAQQVLVTGAIAATMTIGILAAKELSREGVLANTAFGRKMLTSGFEPHRVEQTSLLAGGAFTLIIIAMGIPAILLQWGTRFSEITAFVGRTFTGIDIGGFRLSLSGILLGLTVFICVLILSKLLQRWLSKSVFPRSNFDPGISDSIKAGIGYTGFAVAALLAVISAGFDLSSLAIIAGALSLGIGFGLQNIVSNFVSGLILLVERPIKVGDWVTVGAAEGTVKRISVRATEVETFQRESIIVPNSELINSQVGNWTLKSKNGRVDVPIGIAYGSDARLAEKILYEIADEHVMVSKKPEPSVWFSQFGASSLDFVLRMYLYDINNQVTVETEVRFEILRLFGENDIEIPFPQQDVNLKMMESTAIKKSGNPAKSKASNTKKSEPARKRPKTAPTPD